MISTAVPKPLKLLVVEDHQLYIEGLRHALSSAPFEIEMVARHSVAQAQSWLIQHSAHLVLLDIGLPDGDGWQLLEWIERLSPPIPCAVLTASDSQADLQKALSYGARGYINKGVDSYGLLSAINTILNGDIYTPARDALALSGREKALADGITPRQYDVLSLLAAGCPNKVICQRLNLTGDTVKSHLKALFQHFAVHNRTECVASAVRQKLVDISPEF